MRRFTLMILSLLILFCLTFGVSAHAAPIKLKAVSAWPTGIVTLDMFKEWIKTVNERGEGKVQIELIGGPEVTPMPEQIGALKRGVFDILLTAAGYYMGTIPEAEAFGLSRITPQDERANGFYDFMDQIHQQNGFKYIGRAMAMVPLGVMSINKKIDSPKELKGMKIRTVIIYDAFIRELGAVPVTIPEPEIYTSMERGVVDGFVAPLASGFVRQGFHEIVKYIIPYYFYQIPTVVVANLKSWEKLPEDVQKLLIDAIVEVEEKAGPYYKNVHDTELKKAQELGVQLIEFSPEDAKWFVDTAYRVSWENLAKKAPENVEKLRELSVK